MPTGGRFVQISAGATAAGVLGANDRINVGLIRENC